MNSTTAATRLTMSWPIPWTAQEGVSLAQILLRKMPEALAVSIRRASSADNQSTVFEISPHSIPHIPSVLKCSYGALYPALNEPSVSDLCASVEYEISKDEAVSASQQPFRKCLLKEMDVASHAQVNRESLRFNSLRLSLYRSSLVGATFSQFPCLHGWPFQNSRSSVSWLSPHPRTSVLRWIPHPRASADKQ